MIWLIILRATLLFLALFMTLQSVSSLAAEVGYGGSYGLTFKNTLAASLWALFAASMGWMS